MRQTGGEAIDDGATADDEWGRRFGKPEPVGVTRATDTSTKGEEAQ
ncbi:MAG: hypothetical protein Q7S49_02535 [bacterium]|nr:hypothetical protein [bacterium]